MIVAMKLEAMLDLYGNTKKGVAILEKGMKITDSYINAQTKLNGALQTQVNLQNKVYAAANRSRQTYMDMASTVTELGRVAGDAFKNNDETIKFAELAQKSLKLGGASSKEQTADMDLVTKSMASGKLSGGDFTTLMEDAPMLEQALSNFTGKSTDELEKMGKQGEITAYMIKGALFAASDSIDEKFAAMPMTFADEWNKIKTAGIQAFSGIMENINTALNSEGVQDFINNIIVGIFAAAAVIQTIGDILAPMWGFIATILEFIGGVLLGAIILGLAMVANAALTAALAFMVTYWPITLIAAAVVLVINIFGALGISVRDVFSFIGGAIGVTIALFINMGKVIVNSFFAIANVINSVISGAINFVLDGVNGIIGALNKIPGVKIETVGEFKALSQIEYLEPTSYSDAYSKGSDITGGAYDSLSGKMKGLTAGLDDKLNVGNYQAPTFDDLGSSSNPLTVQGTGSNGSMGVNMEEEDLQYLRDMAERDYINKFSSKTLAPNIQVSFGDVHQTADIDMVAGRMQKILQEQIATTAEGVY